jgi:hypothetical protein
MTGADIYELLPRLTSALEAVLDGNFIDAEGILEDLISDVERAEKDTGDE